jgi:hypothetical protein
MSKFGGKWGLMLKALVFVLPLLAAKTLFHYANLEIVSVGPVITALIAGVFFVIAIILSGVLADFKESEKMPGDLITSIEAIYKDTRLIGGSDAAGKMLVHVQSPIHTVISNFTRQGRGKWCYRPDRRHKGVCYPGNTYCPDPQAEIRTRQHQADIQSR